MTKYYIILWPLPNRDKIGRTPRSIVVHWPTLSICINAINSSVPTLGRAMFNLRRAGTTGSRWTMIVVLNLNAILNHWGNLLAKLLQSNFCLQLFTQKCKWYDISFCETEITDKQHSQISFSQGHKLTGTQAKKSKLFNKKKRSKKCSV